MVLLDTIVNQDYRPIEIIVVDDGSTDQTPVVMKRFAQEATTDELKLVYARTGAASKPRGPASARNLGIRLAEGQYILLLDADFILSNPTILTELYHALQEHPLARFRADTLPESWLEQNLIMDRQRLLLKRAPFDVGMLPSTAFRREILERFRLDETLGVGEDKDMLLRMERAGIPKPVLISATGFKHNPLTLREFARQKEWAGRTSLLFLKKYHAPGDLFLLAPVLPIPLVAGALIGLFVSPVFAVLSAGCYATLAAYSLARSPTKDIGRLFYLIFVRLFIHPLVFTIGLVEGLLMLLVSQRIDPSRRE